MPPGSTSDSPPMWSPASGAETWNTIQGGVWNSQHRYGEAIGHAR